MLGRDAQPDQVHFRIKVPSSGGWRDPATGFFHRPMDAPFLIDDPAEHFYFGGNSLCYALQWAHVMGASAVYLMGFTLQSGSSYFFLPEGQKPTKHSGIYSLDRALAFLRLVEERKPGWMRLVDGWAGPIYDLLPSTSLAEALSPSTLLPSVGEVAIETPW